MVEVASVLDPLLDSVLGLVEAGGEALTGILNILGGDVKHRLRVVLWDRECNGNEGEEGRECSFHRRKLALADRGGGVAANPGRRASRLLVILDQPSKGVRLHRGCPRVYCIKTESEIYIGTSKVYDG